MKYTLRVDSDAIDRIYDRLVESDFTPICFVQDNSSACEWVGFARRIAPSTSRWQELLPAQPLVPLNYLTNRIIFAHAAPSFDYAPTYTPVSKVRFATDEAVPTNGFGHELFLIAPDGSGIAIGLEPFDGKPRSIDAYFCFAVYAFMLGCAGIRRDVGAAPVRIHRSRKWVEPAMV